MNNVGAVAIGAGFRGGLMEAASVADELKSVGVEGEGEIAGGAEGLPTARFAEGVHFKK